MDVLGPSRRMYRSPVSWQYRLICCCRTVRSWRGKASALPGQERCQQQASKSVWKILVMGQGMPFGEAERKGETWWILLSVLAGLSTEASCLAPDQGI